MHHRLPLVPLLLGLLFLTGCVGPGPRDLVMLQIPTWPGIVILIFLTTLFFHGLTKAKDLKWNNRMAGQFAILLVASVIVLILYLIFYPYHRNNSFLTILAGQMWAILSIPHLLGLGAALLVFLPAKNIFYLPSALAAALLAYFSIVFFTDNDEFFLVTFFISLGSMVILIPYAAVKWHRLNKNQQNKNDNDVQSIYS